MTQDDIVFDDRTGKELVHFAVKSNKGMWWEPACETPAIPHQYLTEDVVSITCEACKNTEAFKEAEAKGSK